MLLSNNLIVSNRQNKNRDVMKLVKNCLDNGRYIDTRHGNQRQRERGITRFEVAYVLQNGFHEKKKDEYKEEFSSWNYSVRGKTLEQKELRIVVSFDEVIQMLIITAIDLTKG